MRLAVRGDMSIGKRDGVYYLKVQKWPGINAAVSSPIERWHRLLPRALLSDNTLVLDEHQRIPAPQQRDHYERTDESLHQQQPY